MIIRRPLEALLGCMLFDCSTNAIIGRFAIACCKKYPFNTNIKIILMGTQIHKVLVVFVLPFATVSKLNFFFFYLWVIVFKIVNKLCLNLIQKACIMVVVIRNKTQWIVLEATICSQVVYNQGMQLAVFFTPMVALDFVLYQELVIFSKIPYNNGFIFPKVSFLILNTVLDNWRYRNVLLNNK